MSKACHTYSLGNETFFQHTAELARAKRCYWKKIAKLSAIAHSHMRRGFSLAATECTLERAFFLVAGRLQSYRRLPDQLEQHFLDSVRYTFLKHKEEGGKFFN